MPVKRHYRKWLKGKQAANYLSFNRRRRQQSLADIDQRCSRRARNQLYLMKCQTANKSTSLWLLIITSPRPTVMFLFLFLFLFYFRLFGFYWLFALSFFLSDRSTEISLFATLTHYVNRAFCLFVLFIARVNHLHRVVIKIACLIETISRPASGFLLIKSIYYLSTRSI